MNRLYHLEQTLPLSILATASYPDREFIILNYGSKDSLHQWVQKNLKKYIDAGIVKYLRTKIPKNFVATHAKNIAHKQASGDILCNVDADNIVLEGYPEYLAETFQKNKCIVSSPPTDIFNVAGSCGKIAVLKEHFYSVNGYDENLNLGWGWDDTNFQFRARMLNDLKYIVVEKKWCVSLNHSNCERSRNFRNSNIEETKQISIEKCIDSYYNKNYIVNNNITWGFIEDLTINSL